MAEPTGYAKFCLCLASLLLIFPSPLNTETLTRETDTHMYRYTFALWSVSLARTMGYLLVVSETF